MPKRVLLIVGEKTFKVGIPEDAMVTFGPWAPPKKGDEMTAFESRTSMRGGTLRVYKSGRKDCILACFSGVASFRDLSEIDYSELIAREEGAVVWKNDERGYEREDKTKSTRAWVPDPATPALPAKRSKRKGAIADPEF